MIYGKTSEISMNTHREALGHEKKTLDFISLVRINILIKVCFNGMETSKLNMVFLLSY